MQAWYKSWFDSPYYHILYRNRNDAEAQLFLNNIIKFLKPKPESKMLDQACGKGRHAIYLNNLGFDVTGIDLSEQSIAHCRQFENSGLHFFVQDMREIFRSGYFNYVFNIFTSFGYFNLDEEQQLSVDSAAVALRANGKYIIDFMNSAKVIRELRAKENIEIDNINFRIEKRIDNGFIKKKIQFNDDNKNFEFEETVEAMTLTDFERYFKHAGLKIENVFGSYALEKFDENTSDRLMIIATKK